MYKIERLYAILARGPTLKNIFVLTTLLLVGCTSQPRFVHHGGDPEQMFDNKTAQECWAGPVQIDDGTAEVKALQDQMARNNREDPAHIANFENDRLTPGLKEAEARAEYLKDHSEEQKVHPHGLPYCADLK